MATVHNHIDSSSVTGGPWLTTYSRALSSIYGTDEDHCWDYLLSSSIDSRANTPSNTNTTSTPSNNANSLYYNNNTQDMASTLAPLSPATLSHALCKIGFDCIDYFTATQLDDDNDDDAKPPTPTPSPVASAYPPVYTSPMLDELTDADWRTGLAAAVCGKRTAALERKRVLSRTMSQDEFFSSENGMDMSPLAPLTAANIATVSAVVEPNTSTTNDEEANPTDRRRKRDPWFEALDRLARWDEVAYR
ncbi:MAG: hypothetical protein JOS17DRAFT_775851 [Linnemannia elongata]|nr:MAG: hypothetical protein JOS17DRAFT_775851 [Linnemannia elongata]